MHHHGWSDCFVLIQAGSFRERMQSGFDQSERTCVQGDVIHTYPSAKHDLLCTSDRAQTVHVYTPPIKKELATGTYSRNSADHFLDAVSIGVRETGISPEQFKNLLNSVRENSIPVESEYFMNQLFSGILPEALASQAIVAATKATLATFEASPVFTLAEREVVESLSRLLGWDAASSEGIAVPGGSAANFMSIHCARQMKFPDSRDEGNCGRKFRIFVSEDSHYSWKKACLALGLGLKAVVTVKADANGKLIPDDLEVKISQTLARGEVPLLAAATAGTTVTGAFDPIRSMSEICQHHELWLHVDGAWGGPVVFSKNARHLVDGIELADSLTFDAHKLLGANLTSSLFLTQHESILSEANNVAADYLFHDEDSTPDRGKLSWQCGRSADAFAFWSIWKRYGTDGIENFIDRQFDLKNKFVESIKNTPRLKLLHNPEFLNVCVQVLPPEGSEQDSINWSKRVRETLRSENKAMINYSTTAEGLTFLRFILANPNLHIEHLNEILHWSLSVR